MSKEDVRDVQKEWEIYDWQRGLSLIRRIQCIKEPTVLARTEEIFEKCGCTTNEVKDLSRFRGGSWCGCMSIASYYNFSIMHARQYTYMTFGLIVVHSNVMCILL